MRIGGRQRSSHFHWSLAWVLLLAGCLPTDDSEGGAGAPVDSAGIRDMDRDTPGDQSGPGDQGTPDLGEMSDRSPDQTADPGNDLSVPDLPDEPVDELWEQWGTRGTTAAQPRSPDGYAWCGLADIRSDDLNNEHESSVPGGDWGSTPIEDDPGRCGDDWDTLIWRLVNCERLTRDLAPLRCDLRLVWLGREHSTDMIQRDFFDHENPDGEDPFDRMANHGITFSWAGENIAQYPDLVDAHWGWMDSTQGHRDNILETHFRYTGTGIIRSGAYYWLTQEFITP